MKRPRVTSTTHVLPFDRLEPRDFERMCLALVKCEGYERVEHIGYTGQDSGRDIEAWLGEKRYIFQCKRVSSFSRSDALSEISKIDTLDKKLRPHTLVFITSCAVTPQTRDAVKLEVASRYSCEFWAITELDEIVWTHKEVLHQFFNLPTATEFFPSALKFIPSPPEYFLGREIELAESTSLIEGGLKIITIHGMGGVGKSSLAFKIADSVADTFPDGMFYLDFRAEESEISQQSIIKLLLSMASSQDSGPMFSGDLSTYRQAFNNRKAVILLDNVADPSQLTEITTIRSCLFIITSRLNFTVSGARQIKLNPLDAEEAVELVMNIAPRVTREQALTIRDVCGDLPLALKLVGSILANRPDWDFNFLVTSLKEQKIKIIDQGLLYSNESLGLEASIRASYSSLTKTQKVLFRAICTFPVSFNLKAALCVFDDAEELREDRNAIEKLHQLSNNEMMGELLRCALVQFDEKKQIYWIHSLLKEFGRENSTPKEKALWGYRHSDYFFHFLNVMDHYYKMGTEARLAVEQETEDALTNIIEGHRWAVNNRELDSKAMELVRDYPDAATKTLRNLLDESSWIEWLELAIEAAEKTGNLIAKGFHLGTLGQIFDNQGKYEAAKVLYLDALAISRVTKHPSMECTQLGNLGLCYYHLKDYEPAEMALTSGVDLARRLSDKESEMIFLGSLAQLKMTQGDDLSAIDNFLAASILAKELDDVHFVLNIQIPFNQIIKKLGYEPQMKMLEDEMEKRGIQFAGKEVETYKKWLLNDTRDGSFKFAANYNEAWQLYMNGQYEEAEELTRENLEISENMQNGLLKARSLGFLGNLSKKKGDYIQAAQLIDQAISLFSKTDDKQELGIALLGKADVMQILNKDGDAITQFAKAYILLVHTDAKRSQYALEEIEKYRLYNPDIFQQIISDLPEKERITINKAISSKLS